MNINDVIKKEIAINFGNKENAIKLLTYLDDKGYTWNDGVRYINKLEDFVNDKTNLVFDKYTCIVPSAGQVGGYKWVEKEELEKFEKRFDIKNKDFINNKIRIVDFFYKVIDFDDFKF